MSDESQSDTPLSRALEERRRLQTEIQRAVKELEDVERFIALHRRFSANEEEAKEESAPIFSHVGHGQAQPVFEQLVVDVIRQAERPMQSGEIVEAFRERGHPIGGNETRAAWNRPWVAKERGVLVNFSRLGYWPANDPPPANLASLKPPPRRRGDKRMLAERRGKPRGRQPYLNDVQKEQVLTMFASGMNGPQIAAQLGVSPATVYDVRRWDEKRKGETS